MKFHVSLQIMGKQWSLHLMTTKQQSQKEMRSNEEDLHMLKPIVSSIFLPYHQLG